MELNKYLEGVFRMSTLETTTTMLRDLNEEELLTIQWLISKIKNMQGLFQPKSKEEVLARLDESKRQADAGNYKSADLFIEELYDKYEL